MEILGNIFKFTGVTVGIIIAAALLFLLWKSTMEMVDDKILDIKREARKDHNAVKPWIVAMAHSHFWFVIAMTLAPLLVVGYGVYLIIVLFSYEIWEGLSESYKNLSRRVQRR